MSVQGHNKLQLWLGPLLLIVIISFIQASAGACTLISGNLIKLSSKPLFKFQKARRFTANRYPLSHTQFYIKSGNGQTYQVLLNNLYYTFITHIQAVTNHDIGISADLTRRFPAGSSVDVCGQIVRHYSHYRVHMVYPNTCPKISTSGFLRINGRELTIANNYCMVCECTRNN